MVILIDDMRLQAIVERLQGLGLSKRRAICFLDECWEDCELECDEEYLEYSSRENLRLLDTAARLLREGFPIDLVCYVTGISMHKLLYFLEENE